MRRAGIPVVIAAPPRFRAFVESRGVGFAGLAGNPRQTWMAAAGAAALWGLKGLVRQTALGDVRRRVARALVGAPLAGDPRSQGYVPVEQAEAALFEGRVAAEQPIQARQLMAEQPVEIAHRRVRVVVAEPPEPVGALAQRELTFDRSALLRRQAFVRQHFIDSDLGQHQEIPARVFIWIADPCRQCAVHPAAGNHVTQRLPLRLPRCSLRPTAIRRGWRPARRRRAQSCSTV